MKNAENRAVNMDEGQGFVWMQSRYVVRGKGDGRSAEDVCIEILRNINRFLCVYQALYRAPQRSGQSFECLQGIV